MRIQFSESSSLTVAATAKPVSALPPAAPARTHRPGQRKGVFVYHLWVEGTIEEMILGKLRSKQALFNETIDSLATPFTEEILFEVFNELLRKYKINPRR